MGTMAAHTGAGRTAVLVAGYECFAELGYAAATTTVICERASVSSGTFFHFFPTKIRLLTAILEDAVTTTGARVAELRDLASDDAEAALDRWLDTAVDDADDPHFAGFVAAVGSVPDDARVAELLAAEASLTGTFAVDLVMAGVRQGRWTPGGSPAETAMWLSALVEGAQARAASDPAMRLRRHRDSLGAAARRLLV